MGSLLEFLDQILAKLITGAESIADHQKIESIILGGGRLFA